MRFPPVTALFVFTILAAAAASHAQTTYWSPTPERPALVRVDVQPDPVSIEALQSLDLDIAYVGKRGEGIHVVADAEDLAALLRSGFPHTVLHRDLVAHYQSGFDPNLSRSLDLGSMGGFYTLTEVEAKLDEFRTDYPNLITAKTSIGQSREGRDIWAVKISDNPDVDENEPETVIDCLTHAREPQGMMSTMYFMDWVLENYPADPLAAFLVDEREMWFVPVHNPDGYYYNEQIEPAGGGGWRKNRRHNYGNCYGVDLNRNWGYKWGYDNKGSSPDPSSATYRGPYSMSEPETQALATFIAARGAVERMSIHCYGDMWLLPWCYRRIVTPDDAFFRELASEMAPPEYDVGTAWELLYTVNGGSLDYDYGQLDIVTFSPEMGRAADGFWPRTNRIIPIAEQNLPSLQYYFGISGSYVIWEEAVLDDSSGGNGNGYAEPGETVELTVDVMNRGLADCGTPVVLNLSTSSLLVNITSSTAQISALSSRESGGTAGQAFVFEIDSSAEHGDTYVLELEILFDGARLAETREYIIGVPRRLVFDDMEDDSGWHAGLPGDTADTGAWERADPVGTWSDGNPVQPEDDTTPGGTRCFITENGPVGGGPAEYDVDGGFTTLVSPLFDLTGCRQVSVCYDRWYVTVGGSEWGATRFFQADISNNGGATWQTLEFIEKEEAKDWIEVAISIESVIAYTDRMRMRFIVEDTGTWMKELSLTEAGIDEFYIEEYSTKPVLSLFGELAPGDSCDIHMAWDGGSDYKIYASPNLGGGITMPGGTWYLPKPRYLISTGTIPSSGRVMVAVNVPNNPGLSGKTFYFQGFATPSGGGDPQISNYTSGVVN